MLIKMIIRGDTRAGTRGVQEEEGEEGLVRG